MFKGLAVLRDQSAHQARDKLFVVMPRKLRYGYKRMANPVKNANILLAHKFGLFSDNPCVFQEVLQEYEFSADNIAMGKKTFRGCRPVYNAVDHLIMFAVGDPILNKVLPIYFKGLYRVVMGLAGTAALGKKPFEHICPNMHEDSAFVVKIAIK